MNSYLPAELFVILVWGVTVVFVLEILSLTFAWLRTASWSKAKGRVIAVERVGRARHDRTLSGKEVVIKNDYIINCIYEYKRNGQRIVGTKVNLADFGCFRQNFEQEQFEILLDAKESGREIDIFVELPHSNNSIIFKWVSLGTLVPRILGLAIGSFLIIVGYLGWLDTDIAGSPPMLSFGLSVVGVLLGTGAALFMRVIMRQDPKMSV